jgi:hypothetical protein
MDAVTKAIADALRDHPQVGISDWTDKGMYLEVMAPSGSLFGELTDERFTACCNAALAVTKALARECGTATRLSFYSRGIPSFGTYQARVRLLKRPLTADEVASSAR